MKEPGRPTSSWTVKLIQRGESKSRVSASASHQFPRPWLRPSPDGLNAPSPPGILFSSSVVAFESTICASLAWCLVWNTGPKTAFSSSNTLDAPKIPKTPVTVEHRHFSPLQSPAEDPRDLNLLATGTCQRPVIARRAERSLLAQHPRQPQRHRVQVRCLRQFGVVFSLEYGSENHLIQFKCAPCTENPENARNC